MSGIDPSLLFFQQQQAPAEPEQQQEIAPQQPEIPEDPSQNERDQVLAELLYQLCPPNGEDSEAPLIPDALLSYYLQRAGFQTDNLAVTRLVGLATQKFMADIVGDAYAYARTRSAGPSTGVGRPAKEDEEGSTAKGKKKAAEKEREKARTVLTMEDLNNALEEYGIQANRAPYYL